MNRPFCMLLFLITLQIYRIDGKIDSKLLCSSEFCQSFDEDDCPNTSDFCDVQNATHSGIFLPSPTLCNCCTYCIAFLFENDICTKGALGSEPSGDMCGPNLYCTVDDPEEDAVCLRMKSDCHDAQDEYDKKRNDGTLGFLEQRPICGPDGDYGPVKCIPGQTCSCQSKTGKKIYGEVLNEKNVGETMSCECSRKIDTMEELLDRHDYGGVRCQTNGLFDRIQCLEKRCFCVFNDTGLLSSNEIIDLDTQLLTALPCYNKELNPDPKDFFRPCEKERNEILFILNSYKEDDFEYLGSPIPICQPDGNFYKIQVRDEKKLCVTSEGDQIESYESTLSDKDMNCNCARTSYLLKSSSNTHVLPSCCKNGNWNPLQCRKNFCYCVDEDGNQIEKEVEMDDVESLSCYNNKNCKTN